MLAVPLLREKAAIGAILLRRTEARQPFSEKQIDAASQTFADQAVIAIENVRLFEEVQARTARADGVARVSDRDQRRAQCHQPLAFELQPVLDAIVQTAAQPLPG